MQFAEDIKSLRVSKTQQNISELEIAVDEDNLDDEYAYSDENQNNIINEIKNNMDVLRKANQNSSGSGHSMMLGKHKFMRGQRRQSSRQFKDSDFDCQSSRSQRSVSITCGKQLTENNLNIDPSPQINYLNTHTGLQA